MPNIYTDPPRWEAEGVEPPSKKQEDGWEPGEKPPAPWLNWWMTRTYRSLLEVADAVRVGGPTTNRPTNPSKYAQYFDDDLGHPIWWNGSQWVDASGNPV